MVDDKAGRCIHVHASKNTSHNIHISPIRIKIRTQLRIKKHNTPEDFFPSVKDWIKQILNAQIIVVYSNIGSTHLYKY
jgi:hypothetical protein